MDIIEMRARTAVELNGDLSSLLQEQFSLRMQKGMGQMTNLNELRQVRRDIARVKTIMTEKSAISEKSDVSGQISGSSAA